MILHLRRNAVAYLALFVALGGTSLAAVKLGKSSVTNRTIKAGAVTNTKIAKNAVTGTKVKNGSLSSADLKKGTLLKGATGPKGDKGDPGPSTGAAGGDLQGNYPNPTIKRLGDWTGLGGVCRVVPSAAWTTPAGYDSVAYRVDRDGVVHIRGAASCPMGVNVSVVGALPPGLRPLKLERFAIVETDAAGTTTYPNTYATVEPVNGELQVANYTGTAGDIFTFNGIEFDTKH